MATWQLLLAVWAIGIPGLLLTPALLPPRRSLEAPLARDELRPTPAAVVVEHCAQTPRRTSRGDCVRPLTEWRRTRRAAAS